CYTCPGKEGLSMKKTAGPGLGPYLDEYEQQVREDYEWVLHNPELHRKHGGKVIVVHRRKVCRVGKDHVAAWAAASRKRGCPSRHKIAFVVVPFATPA